MRFKRGDIIQLIYLDHSGRLTQRYVRVITISDDLLVGYCYYRRKPRSFARKNILSAQLERRTAS